MKSLKYITTIALILVFEVVPKTQSIAIETLKRYVSSIFLHLWPLGIFQYFFLHIGKKYSNKYPEKYLEKNAKKNIGIFLWIFFDGHSFGPNLIVATHYLAIKNL